MGGTSCDVSLIADGAAAVGSGREVGGRALALPMVDVHTVGAGGGSIAWRDAGGALRVGPRSAGADPGPACYGRGGERPDGHGRQPAAGHLDADSPLAGGVRLDRAAAGAGRGRAGRRARPRARGDRRRHRARGECRDGPGGARRDGASAASTRASSRSCRSAARARCTRRQIAEELGMRRVLVPVRERGPVGVGLVVAERRRDSWRACSSSATSSPTEAIGAVVERLAERGAEELRRRRLGGRAARHLRPSLRGPGLRATGARRPGAGPAGAARAPSTARTRSATGTRIRGRARARERARGGGAAGRRAAARRPSRRRRGPATALRGEGPRPTFVRRARPSWRARRVELPGRRWWCPRAGARRRTMWW